MDYHLLPNPFEFRDLSPVCPDKKSNAPMSISNNSDIEVVRSPKAPPKSKLADKVAKASEQLSGQKKKGTPPKKRKEKEEIKKEEPQPKKVKIDKKVLQKEESRRVGQYQQG